MSITARGLYESVKLPLGNSINIRLLEIINAKDDEPMECTLHLASLVDPLVQYTALSYMWGEEPASNAIIINGRVALVRKNLRNFLSQRRSDQRNNRLKEQPTFLWIDAICIDQANIAERNHQVAVMGQIYITAHNVLAWLGTEHDCRRFSDLKTFAEYHISRNYPDTEDTLDNLIGSFYSLYNQEYWSRAWIVQECVLARQLDLQCSSLHILNVDQAVIDDLCEQVLDDGVDSAREKSLREILKKERLLGGRFVLETRKNWQRGDREQCYIVPWQLSVVILQCFDSRDRIYSLLPVLDRSIKVQPDYGKTAEQLFLDLVLQFEARLTVEDVFCLEASILCPIRVNKDEPLQDQSLPACEDGFACWIEDNELYSDSISGCPRVTKVRANCFRALGLIAASSCEHRQVDLNDTTSKFMYYNNPNW